MSKHGNNRGRGNKGSNSNQTPANPDRCLYRPPAGILSVRIEPTTEDHNRDAKQETYQARQISLARRLNIITGIAAGLSLIALTFLYRSTQAATSQAVTAQSEFNSSQRPWVSADMQSGWLDFKKESVAIEATGVYSNFGHSVALKVVHTVVLVPFAKWNGHECDWTDAKREDYEKADTIIGTVIFPGQPLHDVPGSSMNIMNPELVKELSGNTPLQLVSCVTYISPIDKHAHHTRSVYTVAKTIEGGGLTYTLELGGQKVTMIQDFNGATAD